MTSHTCPMSGTSEWNPREAKSVIRAALFSKHTRIQAVMNPSEMVYTKPGQLESCSEGRMSE